LNSGARHFGYNTSVTERAEYRTDPATERPGVILSLRGNDLVLQPAGDAGELAGLLREQVVYDRRRQVYRALPIAYRTIRERLDERYQVTVEFDDHPALPFDLRVRLQPRAYQREALDAWLAADRRGVVVLPTGAGKTLVGLMAIEQVRLWTLILVPTIDLLEQWRSAVIRHLGVSSSQAGAFGGGSRDLLPITVMTYDSGTLHTAELNRFGLLIFDEVHHLPAPSYRLIAEGTFAPYRLGLSATPERTDGAHADLDRLVGPVVYQRLPAELSRQRYIARYREVRLQVELSPGEELRYRALMETYRSYLRRRRLRIESAQDFEQHLVRRSGFDPAAKEAMLAHQQARQIALNAEAKIGVVAELLQKHAGEKVLIFSEYNALVERLSRELCIPAITHKTGIEERRAILERFRSGRYTKLVTGRVLNEGVDVPDATVAIMVSGSATRREYIQRLGRVLRPKDTPALLYEIVTRCTAEVHAAERRHNLTRTINGHVS
jgi:superfamily II DNA or RNA helicase